MALKLNKVLVADAVDQSCIDLLKSNGFQVDNRNKLPKDILLQEIKNYDGLIVRSQTKVSADVLQAASSLRVVGRAGTGVDNIDVNAATKKGVIVLNTPGGNSVSACELTCALIMSLARNVTQGCQSLKEGRWDRALYTGNELSGKTLAIIGLGRIGREVAFRMQAFGMKTIGFDPMISHPACKAVNIEKFDNIDDLFPHADYITVHTPLIPQTRNLINERTLGLCKKGVKIINVARGGIIDEAALLSSLQNGHCGGAALDVFLEEPPKHPVTLELIAHPKVVVTPHLGASTKEAQTRVAVEVAEQFIALKNPQSGYSLTGVVNAPILTASQNPENIPWLELTKSLGKYAIKIANVENLENTTAAVTCQGDNLKDMNFLSTAALVGMLSGRTKNGLNLINAPTLAKEAGIKITLTHVPGADSNSITVTVKDKEEHSITGALVGDENAIITKIDDAQFSPGVPINSNIILFQGSNAGLDFQKIVEEINKKNLTISNIAVATGKKVWFAVQVSGPETEGIMSPIPGIEVY